MHKLPRIWMKSEFEPTVASDSGYLGWKDIAADIYSAGKLSAKCYRTILYILI